MSSVLTMRMRNRGNDMRLKLVDNTTIKITLTNVFLSAYHV